MSFLALHLFIYLIIHPLIQSCTHTHTHSHPPTPPHTHTHTHTHHAHQIQTYSQHHDFIHTCTETPHLYTHKDRTYQGYLYHWTTLHISTDPFIYLFTSLSLHYSDCSISKGHIYINIFVVNVTANLIHFIIKTSSGSLAGIDLILIAHQVGAFLPLDIEEPHQ